MSRLDRDVGRCASTYLMVGDVNGVGVQPFPEQCCHLFLGDLGPFGHRPDLVFDLLGHATYPGIRQ